MDWRWRKRDAEIPLDFDFAGLRVSSSGELSDGRALTGVRQYQDMITADSTRLLQNLEQQFTVSATGRSVRFGDRAAIAEIVRRPESHGGGIRTLVHELIGSPLFTGEAATIERPADLPKREHVANKANHGMGRMMMTQPLVDIVSPVMAKIESPPVAEPSAKFTFAGGHSVQLRVHGLFIPERAEDFAALLKDFAEARLLDLDYQTASATIAYADESDLFRGAKPEQIIERLNNRIRQLPGHTLGVAAPRSIPRDALERVEFAIVGLDCKACSLGVYNILTRVDGVEQATASFHDRLAIAWINAEKTSREDLEAALKSRGVQLKMP